MFGSAIALVGHSRRMANRHQVVARPKDQRPLGNSGCGHADFAEHILGEPLEVATGADDRHATLLAGVVHLSITGNG